MNKFPTLLLSALLIPRPASSLVGSAVADANAPAPKPFHYQKFKLDNGLTVLLHKDASSPLVAVNLWYKVGSKNEAAGKTGFAHLFEHYMFECTKHLGPNEYFNRIFKDLGGTTNATTSYDRTDYFAVVPSGGLDEVLRLESSRMGWLQDCIRRDLLDKQRGIVQNEKRMREGQPYGKLFGEIMGGVFGEGHPYHWPVIGYMKDLEAATVDDVGKFHETFYAPNNAVLAVSGDIDFSKTYERIRFWFDGIAPKSAPPALNAPQISGLGGRREASYEDAKAQLPMLVLSYPIPGLGKPGYTEISVAAQVLGGGRTSRLEKALKSGEVPLVLDLGANVVHLHENDIFYITAVPSPGVSLERLEAAIQAEIAAVVRDGLAPKELDRVKIGMEFAAVNELQKIENIAAAMVEGEAVSGDPELFLNRALEEIRAIRPEAVQAAAGKYLIPKNTSVLHALPKRSAP